MKWVPWVLLLVVVLAWALFGRAEAQEPMVQAYWDAPTTGSPVVYYILRYESIAPGDTVVTYIDDIPPTETGGTVLIPYQYGRTLIARVRGVDARGRAGPYSEDSDPWIDDGPPGPPSAPRRTLYLP